MRQFVKSKRELTDHTRLILWESHLKALVREVPYHVGDEVFGSLEVWRVNAARAVQDNGNLGAWVKIGNRPEVGMELGKEGVEHILFCRVPVPSHPKGSFWLRGRENQKLFRLTYCLNDLYSEPQFPHLLDDVEGRIGTG